MILMFRYIVLDSDGSVPWSYLYEINSLLHNAITEGTALQQSSDYSVEYLENKQTEIIYVGF